MRTTISVFICTWKSHCTHAVLLAFCWFVAQCGGAGLIDIKFDGQPPGTAYLTTNYIESGTRFTGHFGRIGPATPNRPDNGTAYIEPSGIISPTSAPTTCSRIDNRTFRLLSVDLAGYSSVIPDYGAVFEGRRSDGTVVTTNFVVTGLEFQTYYFPSNFNDLTNVLMAAGALDNFLIQLPTIQPVMRIGEFPDYYSVEWLWVYVEGTPGLSYRLECAESLSDTNWAAIGEFESSGYLTLPKSAETESPQRLFRAVELP